MAWAVWNTFPEVTDAFLCLASATTVFLHILYKSTIERFVVLLYDHTSTCSIVSLAREGRYLEEIPPTQAALEQHVKR